MRKKFVKLLFISGALLFVFLLSACSQISIGAGPGSTSTLSVADVLQKSANAMKQLKSSHFDIQTTDAVQASGATATPTTDKGTASTPVVSGNLNVNIKGSGDQALPDQMKTDLTINQSVNMSEVMKGDKVYIKNPQGQWYVFNKSDVENYVGNPFSGVTFDQNTLLGVLLHTDLKDHGDESLNGQSLRHITANLDKVAFKQLVSSSPQLKSLFGQQDIDQVLNNLKTFNASVDTWIDETNFYVHRTELKVNMMADTSSVGNGAPTAINSNLDSIVDLSKFNETVDITVPSNATPATNPAQIFGLQATP